MIVKLDTVSKIATIQGAVSFEEVEQVKRMIGRGWEKWSICGEAYPSVLFPFTFPEQEAYPLTITYSN